MSVKTCAHVLDNGTVCKSPALGEHKYCFFHIRLHQRPKRRSDGTAFLLLNDLTCVESIQIAISNVLHATNDGLIDSRTANSLYRGLGMALSALRLKLAQQKFEASQNNDDSGSRGHNHFSNFLSLCNSAFSTNDGTRPPSSHTEFKEQSDGAPYLPSVGRCGVPTAPTPSDHPITRSSENQIENGPMTPSPDGLMELTPVLPEKKVKALKRIIRQGPRHPQYYSAFRQLDKHGAAVANVRNGM